MQTKVARVMPRVLTVSESSRRDIAEQLRVPRERIHVVPVGVDPTIFRPLAGTARVPGRIVTTASADVPMKGLAPLLEALAKVRTERIDAHLVVIGAPRAGSSIPARIDTLGLGGAVRFVTGVPTDEIVRLYAQAEVAVVPSLYEGFSLPAIEAMACEVPLVATTGGAIPEVVGDDGATGVLVPPGDAEALASGLRHVLDDPQAARAMAARGRARARARFTWAATAAATADHYRALLDDHRPPDRRPC
jgi:glycosyltransferase involved in cell wall biosynthesis